jgi:hypothetical protein
MAQASKRQVQDALQKVRHESGGEPLRLQINGFLYCVKLHPPFRVGTPSVWCVCTWLSTNKPSLSQSVETLGNPSCT